MKNLSLVSAAGPLALLAALASVAIVGCGGEAKPAETPAKPKMLLNEPRVGYRLAL